MMADTSKEVRRQLLPPEPEAISKLERVQRTLRVHSSHFPDGKGKPRESRDLLKATKCRGNHGGTRGRALDLKAGTAP